MRRRLCASVLLLELWALAAEVALVGDVGESGRRIVV